MWQELKNLWSSDNLMADAWTQSYDMIEMDREMFRDAVDALWQKETESFQKAIVKKDKLINKMERVVRREVLTHLAVQGPTNLAAGLVLSTIIVDIERIGDYVKNIVDIASIHGKPFKAGGFTEDLHKIEAAIADMFDRLVPALLEADDEEALRLWQEYKWINKDCDEAIHKMISGDFEEDLSNKKVPSVMLYYRYLKRINAHLRNIMSSVFNPYDRIGYKHKD